MSRTLVVLAHPAMRLSRINAPMADVARESAPSVHVHDLYATYPDYYIDVAHEQRLLERAQVVVLQFPLQWYAPPSLLKLWLDMVLSYGWAYGPGGRALAGKDLWVAVSASGTVADYRDDGHHGADLSVYLAPLRQTVALTGMYWREPLVLFDARGQGLAQLPAHLARWRVRLGDCVQTDPEAADRRIAEAANARAVDATAGQDWSEADEASPLPVARPAPPGMPDVRPAAQGER